MARSRAKPLATLTLQIQEDTWTLRLWRGRAYERLHGEDSGAITDVIDKTIDFNNDETTLETVGHELFHAYFKYLHLDSVVEPKISDVEEIVASWIGSNLDKFHEKVHYVYNNLKGTPKC